MAFNVKGWAPIAVGMGDSPSIWSYRGPLGDSLDDIKTIGYFNGLSDDLLNADFKTGDFIQVVSFNQEFSLLVMAVGVTNITTGQIAPHELPLSFNLVNITDGIIPTQEQNGFLFYTSTAALTVDLEDTSNISVGTYYRFINASGGILTIDPFGSQTIDGVASPKILQANQSITLMTGITSGGWDTVSDGNIASGAGSGTVTSVGATQPARGITITGSPITTAGVLTFALANDLDALENITGTAFAVRTASETWTTREITGLANNIDVKNGDGIAANPQVSIHPSYVGQGSITTVGTITSGIWTGDKIAIANGGTGSTTAQLAINALTDVASANEGNLLTKDSGGNVSWRAAEVFKKSFGFAEFDYGVAPTNPGRVAAGTNSYVIAGQYRRNQRNAGHFSFDLEAPYVSGDDIEVIVAWRQDSVTAPGEVVEFQVAYTAGGNGDTAVPAPTIEKGQFVIPNNTTDKVISKFTIDGTNLVVGDSVEGEFFRDGGVAPDNYDDDALVTNVTFKQVST
jgi:hypothetical protein